MSHDFEKCTVVIETPVAWGEMDAFQHVNNTVYFKYFESVRMAYFKETGVNAHMEAHNIGPILASTQCRFKAPLTYPDTISIGTFISDLGEDRLTMIYLVKSHKSGRVVAEGEGLIVFYDYNLNQKHPIPSKPLELIKKLENTGLNNQN